VERPHRENWQISDHHHHPSSPTAVRTQGLLTYGRPTQLAQNSSLKGRSATVATLTYRFRTEPRGKVHLKFLSFFNRLDRQNCAGCLPAVGTYYIERYIPSIFIIFGYIRRYIQEVIITASISVVSKPCWVLVFRTFHPLPSPLFAPLRSTMYVTPMMVLLQVELGRGRV
jgi:hypothetical protein